MVKDLLSIVIEIILVLFYPVGMKSSRCASVNR